jgi:hypothetical protein
MLHLLRSDFQQSKTLFETPNVVILVKSLLQTLDAEEIMRAGKAEKYIFFHFVYFAVGFVLLRRV